MYIPPGFNTITPYFFVKGADQFVAFLVKAFGIEVLRSLRPHGCIANTQVRIGTSTIMASEAGGQYAPMPMACYIYVENADKAMEQALAAGARWKWRSATCPMATVKAASKIRMAISGGSLSALSTRRIQRERAGSNMSMQRTRFPRR
jgi:PhnB protein